MPSLKDIRLRIKSVQTTQQSTKAMKMVAASKLRKAQDNIIQLRPYALRLNGLMKNLVGSLDSELSTPYARVREPKNVLAIVITSNRGLCGAFNSSINRLAETQLNEVYAAQRAAGNLHILAIGKKGYEYFSRRGYNMVGENHDLFTGLSFDKVAALAETIMQGYVDGKWDKVEIYYNFFKNVASQIRTREQYLPLSMPEGDATTDEPQDLLFEPGRDVIVTQLIPQILKLQIYRAVLESNASEHGARMLAMDNATENANALIKELRLTFNKARQAAITKEILEIVGGAEALSGK